MRPAAHLDALIQNGSMNPDPDCRCTDTKHRPIHCLQDDERLSGILVERHNQHRDPRKRIILQANGKVFLGIDAGSTTTKAALIDDVEGNLICTPFTGITKGNPVEPSQGYAEGHFIPSCLKDSVYRQYDGHHGLRRSI